MRSRETSTRSEPRAVSLAGSAHLLHTRAPARKRDREVPIETKPGVPRPTDAPSPEFEELATALVTAYRQRSIIEAPSRSEPAFSKHAAQQLAELVRAARIAGGDTPVGYKVGFTNGEVRAQFSAQGPLAAPIYGGTLMSERRIDAGTLLGPRIEPEIVVGIGPDGEPAWAALGFEIVQSHVADWNFTYLDAIADFGLHAALIVGERRAFDPAGFAALSALRVTLRRDGETVETGAAADVDGGPLGSIAWLRTDLQRVGRTLLPGELVSTGSMTRVPAIASGERWTIEADNAELPELTIDVT